MSRYAATQEKPSIGISMRFNLSSDYFYLSGKYAEAVESFGGIPFHLGLIPKKEYLHSALEVLDGLLLPGGGDIDPIRFGAEPKPGLGNVSPLRDEFDWLLLEEAERRSLPVLGICYGMQMLNVFRGGSLIQDIGREVPNALEHEQNEPRSRPSHRIFFEENSRLRQLADNLEFVAVNSHHHQAVKKIGENLNVVAKTSDGIVEALEDIREDKFAIGVEWHPELNYLDDRFALNIFKSFISAAKRYHSLKGT